MNFPLLLALFGFGAMVAATYMGHSVRKTARSVGEEDRDLFDVVLGAALMLLGLLISFGFAMAVDRYDHRKTYEEVEANAIGTEYLRADLLPPAEAQKVHSLLQNYLSQRVLFYTVRDRNHLKRVDAQTVEIQKELWSAVVAGVQENPAPVVTIAVSGMNDVLDSRGFTEAEWRNRIPITAWALLIIIAVLCSFLIGFSASRRDRRLFIVTPAIVSIAFFLICDIESPNAGIIHVVPENLLSVTQSLH